MQLIQLTQGYFAQVDDCDYAAVSAFKWIAHIRRFPNGDVKNVYASRRVKTDGNWTTQMLHRFILGITNPKIQVDHENHNGLNCQRYNLRVATTRQNQGNAYPSQRNKSGLKGVRFNSNPRAKNKWRAEICHKSLGSFPTAIEAAHVYDAAALEQFGSFALTNAALGLV